MKILWPTKVSVDSIIGVDCPVNRRTFGGSSSEVSFSLRDSVGLHGVRQAKNVDFLWKRNFLKIEVLAFPEALVASPVPLGALRPRL